MCIPHEGIIHSSLKCVPFWSLIKIPLENQSKLVTTKKLRKESPASDALPRVVVSIWCEIRPLLSSLLSTRAPLWWVCLTNVWDPHPDSIYIFLIARHDLWWLSSFKSKLTTLIKYGERKADNCQVTKQRLLSRSAFPATIIVWLTFRRNYGSRLVATHTEILIIQVREHIFAGNRGMHTYLKCYSFFN